MVYNVDRKHTESYTFTHQQATTLTTRTSEVWIWQNDRSLCRAQGRRPRQKSRGGTTRWCIVHQCAVHEYQTSIAGVIIESNVGALRCFSLSLYSFSSPTFCHTFFKTRSLSLDESVSRVLLSSPPSGSGRSPAAKRIKCVLLCIIMFNGWAKTVII